MASVYDPSKYMFDYSRYGREIGNALSTMSKEFTELSEHNKLVHEHNKYKEVAYDAVNQYVDSIDENTLSNIVSSMGMTGAMEQGDEYARMELKKIIPKYSDNISSQEYDTKLATEFFVPFMTAAQSMDGGGSINFGKLFSPLRHGGVQSAIMQTEPAKEIRATEREQKAYETGLERKTAEEQAQFDLGQTRSVEAAGIVNNALQNTASPEEAYKFVVDNGGGESEANDAFNKKRQMRQDEETQKKNAQYRKSLIKPEKIKNISPDRYADLRREASAAVGAVMDDIARLKQNKKKIKSVDYETQLDELQRELDIAKENRKNIVNEEKYFIATQGKTAEDAIKARRIGVGVTGAQKEEEGRTYGGYSSEEEGLIAEAQKQYKENGRISNALHQELTALAEQQGITVADLLITVGASKPSTSGGGKKFKVNPSTKSSNKDELDRILGL